MILEVLRIGNPSLREISEHVPLHRLEDSSFQRMLDDMIETMHHLNGAGICAPQIGQKLRVMIFEITKNPRYPEAEPIPLTILINPSFTCLSPEMQEGYEGCLSVGELRGKLPRYKRIKYEGFDRKGEKIEREVADFHAKVFQHEYDHLNGILFIDKVVDTKSFGFTSELIQSGKI